MKRLFDLYDKIGNLWGTIIIVGGWTLLFFGTAAVIGQVSTNAPLRELIIKTAASTNLAATSVRFVPGKFALDPVTFKPLLTGTVEAWANEVEDGKTNAVVIRSQTLTLTAAQLKTWIDAADGKAFLKSALLTKTKLTEKP